VLLVRLWPRSTVHTWPSNQTLFGALCWAVSALYGTARLEELLRRLADDPQELVLSSCMPVLDVGDGVIFLVPKPVVWQAELPGAAGSRRRVDVKRLKRARWASLGAVNAAGSSEASSLCLSAPDLIETPVVLLQGEETGLRLVFSHPKARPTALWTSTEESHNTLNRLTGSTTAPGRLYFTSGWAFSTWCSLYALLHAEGAWEDVLMPALRWACDSGLGGRRGMGRASYDLVDVQDTDSLGLKPNPGTDGWLSLGRVVVPAECGLDLRHSAYELSLSHSRVDSESS